MISSSISKIAEQIHRQVDGGDIALGSKWDIREITLLVEQIANTFVKQEVLDAAKMEGEMIPSGSLLSTFRGVTVTYNSTYGTTSSIIPIKYVQLPLDRGVWRIYANGDEYGQTYGAFVPIQQGGEMFTNIRNVPLVQGQIAYKVEGNTVKYFENIISTRNITSVTMQLVTASGDGEISNLSPDYEYQIIKEVVSLMQQRPMPDMVNDNNPTKPQ